VYRYFYFYLQRELMISQLDAHSKDGWDFVSWIDEEWHEFPGENPTRAALFRSAHPTTEPK
jgi:hypothetical protein